MPATSSQANSPALRPDGAGDAHGYSQRVRTAAARVDAAAQMINAHGDTGLVRSAPAPHVERARGKLRGATPPRTAQPEVAPLAPITAAGGALVAVIAVSLAATLDALISPGMGVLFGFVFVLASVLVALRVCWYDAWAAVALPPLVFIVAAGLAAQVAPVSSGGWLHRTSTDMAVAVLDHPVYLLLGTVLAALAIVHRARVE